MRNGAQPGGMARSGGVAAPAGAPPGAAGRGRAGPAPRHRSPAIPVLSKWIGVTME